MYDPSSATQPGEGAARALPDGRQAVETPANPEAPEKSPVAIIRRSGRGWQVGEEEVADLTSAMVLADLLMPGLPPPSPPGARDPADTGPAGAGPAGAGPAGAGPAGAGPTGALAGEAARLRVTIAQLQHALATRVRVEQAIGVLCERRRVPPRQAFELLRGVARGSGLRLADLATQVVDSAANPLLILPGDLSRPPRQPRSRGRSPRHTRVPD